MATPSLSINLSSLQKEERKSETRARSHRNLLSTDRQHSNTRWKSHEKITFVHNNFNHLKVVKASHDIHHPVKAQTHRQMHEDHSRTVLIKKRIISENLLLDSFPGHSHQLSCS